MKKISSKSLYFNKDMSIGDKINEHDLLAKRPSGGISPSEIGKVINKKLLSNVKKGNQLSIKNFKK